MQATHCASCFIQRCCDQQQCELQEGLKVLRGQLKVTKEQLHQAGEEKTRLEALLEQRDHEGRKSQELLWEKDKEFHLKQQETHQVIHLRKCVCVRCFFSLERIFLMFFINCFLGGEITIFSEFRLKYFFSILTG